MNVYFIKVTKPNFVIRYKQSRIHDKTKYVAFHFLLSQNRCKSQIIIGQYYHSYQFLNNNGKGLGPDSLTVSDTDREARGCGFESG